MESTAAAAGEDKFAKKKGFNNSNNNNNKKRPFDGGGGNGGARGVRGDKKMKKQVKIRPLTEGSAEEVLAHDIRALQLQDDKQDPTTTTGEEEEEALPEPGSEIEVEVLRLSSTGDGLARQPGRRQLYTVPFALPGDTVRAKVYRHLPREHHSVADFLAVVRPGPLRDDARVTCRYFSQCSGCQLQPMAYADQLAHKRAVVSRAFANFSGLSPDQVPAVGDTIGSPLQYGYRTKLTPHFDAPPGTVFRRGKPKEKKFFPKCPDVGFNMKGKRVVLDIEDCPIGTDAVRRGMARERARMQAEYAKYSSGATILLRESTRRVAKKPQGESAAAESEELRRSPSPDADPDTVVVDTPAYRDVKTCVTDNNAQTTEYIDDFVFANAAGSFFQNNNSILPSFTGYIRQHILPPPATTTTTATTATTATTTEPKQIKYLIDAYSGSGLFTITQSALFAGGSVGIDIDDKAIHWARRNAALNRLDGAGQARFLAADAPQLFAQVAAFDPDETVVVLDPPRKGCDGSFLRQLLRFAPRRVVYVSCNVHTQARDVGILVRGEVTGMGDDEVKEGVEEKKPQDDWEAPTDEEKKNGRKVRYEIESIRGFDFFPQTGHVEGVAVLNRVSNVESTS